MRRIALAGVLALLWAGVAEAQGRPQELEPQIEGAALVSALQQGGKVILIRHMATEKRSDETTKFVLEDCATQRNLSEEGKKQAQAIGEQFTRLGIRVDEVLTSPYCRTVDTGKLAFGKATPTDALSVGDALTMEGKLDRAGEIRKLLDTSPPPGTNVVLVTHTGNLLYAFGLDSRPEGIAHVFEPTGTGRANYLGRMNPDQWASVGTTATPDVSAAPPETSEAKPAP